MLSALDELKLLLRPAGGGLFVVSTGKAEQRALQAALYGTDVEAEIVQRFEDTLGQLQQAKGLILGVPSDVGAGFRRGANLAPQHLRLALRAKGFTGASKGVLDIGDVFVVPQLLNDDMCSEAQLEATRAAIYPSVRPEIRRRLPVSPLSITKRALELALKINPQLKLFILGGDHSVALPVVQALHGAHQKPFAIVQPDAHTDLLETRLGIRECFATWSWHANELIGRKERLVQVGIRASGKTKAHWESTLQVKQFWAAEILRDETAALEAVVKHVQALKLEGLYFSNDIDGTDSQFAEATGTPEPHGLRPEFLLELIARLGKVTPLWGGDIVEVAPALGPTPERARETVQLAASYFEATINAALP
jgi:arginase family enzyme